MQVPPWVTSAAASVAGTSHAASKGGESDRQASEGAARLDVSQRPAGKGSETSAVDPGEHTGDRGGDGREMYDRFERRADRDDDLQNGQPDDDEAAHDGTNHETGSPIDAAGGHIDFQA